MDLKQYWENGKAYVANNKGTVVKAGAIVAGIVAGALVGLFVSEDRKWQRDSEESAMEELGLEPEDEIEEE